MGRWWRFTVVGMLAAGMVLTLGCRSGSAHPQAHVYLLRGLMNIFSLGMDSLGAELEQRGISATVTGYGSWQTLADQAAVRYKAGTEGPIILIGHSLGADAVMEMGAYLGRKGIPVALIVPFDCTGPYAASSNVARVLNLTKHYYMSRGPGFHGTLVNVDLTANGNIDHLNIDKSARLHARVIAEVMAIVGARHAPGAEAPTASLPAGSGAPTGAVPKPAAPVGGATPKPETAPGKTGDAGMNASAPQPAAQKPAAEKSAADGATPVIALPERAAAHPAANLPQ